MKHAYSRRKFIRRSLFSSSMVLSLGLGAGLLNGGCGRKKNTEDTSGKAGADGPKTGADGSKAGAAGSCEDFSGVSEEELQKRKSLGYAEKSPIPDNQCQNCNLWLPPVGDQECGGCTLFKGPVYSDAYCTYWAPQV